MYKRRATIVTRNSLTILPKVCRLSIKPFTFLQNLSTATERSDFDNSNGLNGEFETQYDQKIQSPNNFARDGVQMNNGQGKNWNFRGNNGNFRENLDGYSSGSVYGQNPRGEKLHDPVGENETFGDNNSFNGFRTEFQHNPYGQNGKFSAGYAGDGRRDEFQHRPSRQSSNFGRGNHGNSERNLDGFKGSTGGPNGYFASGYTGERRGNEFQQSPVGQTTANVGWRNNENIQQNSSSFSLQSSIPLQESGISPLGFTGGSRVMAQQNVNGSYRQGGIELESGYCSRNGSMYQQNTGDYNVGISEQNRQNYNTAGTGNFQQMQGSYNDANAQMYQQSHSGCYKQSDESTEDGGSIKLNGTIEELDNFFKEGKLDSVVQVLDLFEKQGKPVDLPRYLSLMKKCGDDQALEEAKSIHKHLMRSIPNLELSTFNKILEMYSKCGSMEDAFSVFDKMPRNLTSWDTMIVGLADNGYAEEAIELFTEFKELGLKPDGQMYLGVFSACSALCDITEGMLHFESMSKDYGIVPSMEHYVSVVKMLGSVGCLDEALEFIENMPIEPNVQIWETLMIVSRLQGNVELGDRCAELVELLDPSRLDEQSRAGFIPVKASDLAKEKEKKKLDGQNPLEIRSRVHEYRAGDRSQPDHEKLYELLRGMKNQMKEAGYIPETKVVLHDIDQEGKEEALLSHSERLAVAKGLLNSPARSTMRVIKNLRVCVDCHNAMKIISKLVGRELIMRDAKRFHHFKDGICSCRDYW